MSAPFVGFGFGPIQAGLMIHEALASGSFTHAVIAEVDQALVDAVRAAGNVVSVNIAGLDGIRAVTHRRVALYNPRIPEDRTTLVEAIAESSELATAVPSVDLYAAGGDASIAALFAEGARPGRPRIVYTAENDNYAAEKLGGEIRKRTGRDRSEELQILNTVIGKMSGIVSTDADRERLGLAPLVPGLERCVLVEEFNRIFVSRVTLPGFRRGIQVFEEKDDLLPFEEAKLYGHNAVHALLGYLARLRGYQVMSELRDDEELLSIGRRAFLEESGAALERRYGSAGDPLFTPAGFAAYADDLLLRMTNPFLHDRVERIIRDPMRKLGWNDRFFGTMRMAIEQGIEPRLMALGAAAAAQYASQDRPESARDLLERLWGAEAKGPDRDACLALVEQAAASLSRIPC